MAKTQLSSAGPLPAFSSIVSVWGVVSPGPESTSGHCRRRNGVSATAVSLLMILYTVFCSSPRTWRTSMSSARFASHSSILSQCGRCRWLESEPRPLFDSSHHFSLTVIFPSPKSSWQLENCAVQACKFDPSGSSSQPSPPSSAFPVSKIL